MPQILAIPAALFGATTGSIATGAGIGTGLSAFSTLTGKLVSSLVLGGLSVGLSLLLRPPVPEPQSGSIETQQAVPPRTFVYGRMEVAGSVAFKEKPTGTNILFKIALMHDGEIDAWETLILDDRIVLLDSTGMVTNAFIQDGENRVWMWLHNGSDFQEADAEMLIDFPGIWTIDHKLSGIAYVVCHFHGAGPENFLGAYPNGEPIFKAVIRGRRVFDPRDISQDIATPATWVWSDNPALCILDWIALHPKGYRIDIDKLDLLSFAVMANRCDELVPLTTGVSEKRYRVATQVSLKEPRTNVLARLRESCDAHLYLTGAGKWALRGGAWTAPDVTLAVASGHILDLEMRDGMDALQRYNELSLRYLSPDHNYGEAECDPWQGTAHPEFLAGKVKTRQLDLLQVPSYTQARRLAKLMMAFDNPTFAGRATTNFYGLDAVGERNVTLNWSEPGEDIDGPFWIEPDLELGTDGATVSMSLRAADPTAYDWNPETEEGEAVPLLPPVDLTFTEGVPPANPSDFTVVGDMLFALASWTPPSDAAFYIARLWRAASGAAYSTAIDVSGPRYRPYHWPDPSMELMTQTDPVKAGDYRYWLTVENPVGDRNTPVGPVTVTVTKTVGGAALLLGEGSGFAADFTDIYFSKRVAKKVGGTVTSYGVDAWFSNAGTSPKLIYDNTGTLVWSPHNLFLNSDAPATQNVTLITGETYTMSAAGSGSLAGSVGASGTATPGVPLTFVATGTSGTFTVTGLIGGKISLTRGGVNPYYISTTGAPRFGLAIDHDPVTEAGRGLLVEPAATNLLLRSTEFDNASWVKTNVTAAANATAAPNGRTEADRIVETAVSGTHFMAQAIASTTGTVSIYAKAAERSQILLYDTVAAKGSGFDLTAGTIIPVTGITATSSPTITSVSNGWWRCTIPFTASTTLRIYLLVAASNNYAGDITKGLYLWGAQIETGSVATSFVPTFAASATRAADNINFALSAIPALGSAYSVYARFRTPTVNSGQYAIALTNGTTSEIAGIKAGTGATLSVVDGGAAQAAIIIGTLVANTSVSAAMSVQANDVGGSVAGSAVTSDTSATLPTLTEVRFGGPGSNAVTAATFRIEKVVIVPRAWSDVELMTKSVG